MGREVRGDGSGEGVGDGIGGNGICGRRACQRRGSKVTVSREVKVMVSRELRLCVGEVG